MNKSSCKCGKGAGCCKSKPIQRERRKRGEHLWHEHDGLTKCVTCFCDEDDAHQGGQECSFGQKPGWKPE